MKRTVPISLKKVIEKKKVCTVLITCEAPSEDGNMHVEMTYKGNKALAAYLLLEAQEFIGDEGMSDAPFLRQAKIHPLRDSC